jgi:hypothetical protein
MQSRMLRSRAVLQATDTGGSVVKKLALCMLVVCVVTLAGAGSASASTPTLKKLARTVAALQKKVNAQATRITALSSRIASDEATISTLTSKLAGDEATISAQGAALSTAAPLLAIAPYVSLTTADLNGVKGPNIVFQGANVHVRSTTASDDVSGLGNLIVGWNEIDLPVSTPYRTGSNNLVVGKANNFTSWGCLVAGSDNLASGHCASVSGGNSNTASAGCASVSGGFGNTASGVNATVSGGQGNAASGTDAAVSGGYQVVVNWLRGWSAGGTFHN